MTRELLIDAVPVMEYCFKDGKQVAVTATRVYTVKCKSLVAPLDLDLQWLISQGWNAQTDRIRYSVLYLLIVSSFKRQPEMMFVRRWCQAKDECVIMQVLDTMHINIWGNSRHAVGEWFQHVLVSIDGQQVKTDEVKRAWSTDPMDLMFYCGSVHAMVKSFESRSSDSVAKNANVVGEEQAGTAGL